MNMRYLASGVLLGLVPFACLPVPPTEPPAVTIDHGSVSQGLGVNLRATLVDCPAAMAFLDQTWLGGYAPTTSTCINQEEPGNPGDPVPEPVCEEDPVFAMEETSADAGGLVEFLMDEVFVEANIESFSETSVTYRLGAAFFCGNDSAFPGPGADPLVPEEVPPEDDCAQMFSDLPIRLTVTSPADGDYDIALLIGNDRVMPATFRVYATELGVSVDLAAVKRAIEALAEVSGEEPPPLPERMTGQLLALLQMEEGGACSASLSITEALDVAFASEGIAVEAAPATPALALRGEPDSSALELALGLEAMHLELDLSTLQGEPGLAPCPAPVPGEEPEPCEPPPPPDPWTGRLGIFLDGLHGSVLLNEVADMLELRGLGFGDQDARVLFNDQPLVTLGLNAAAGRSLDVTFIDDPQGMQVSFQPSLGLLLDLNLALLADQVEELPAWMLDELFEVTMTGATSPSLLLLDRAFEDAPRVDQEPGDPPPEPLLESLVKVLSGTLTLRATSLDAPLVVEADQCLNEAEVAEEIVDPHPFTTIEAGVCL